MSLYYSEHALLLNLRGERFVDETLGDHLTAMALLDQPESRGLLIADARVFRDRIIGSYVEGAVAVDKFALASRRGGRVGLAEDLDELAYLPEEWGYHGETVRNAVKLFNEHASTGPAPSPGREQDGLPLDEPPYYVIETVPAITFPFHGVRIDDRARVLDADGQAHPRTPRRRIGHRRPVAPRVRGRPRLGPRLRPHGRGHRHRTDPPSLTTPVDDLTTLAGARHDNDRPQGLLHRRGMESGLGH